jgi:hypothetical protein
VRSPLVHISIRNGVIAGVLGFVLAVLLYFMNRHPFLFPVYFDFRIAVLGVFLVMTLKELRDTDAQGSLSFAQGMVSSFLLTATFATIASGSLLLFGWAVPEFVTSYISLASGQMKAIEEAMIRQFGKALYEQSLR